MQKTNRIEVLDLLRFVAAISVVFYHYLYRGWRTGGLSDVDFGLYDGFLKYGYLGVQVFFVISGFVIYLTIRKRDVNSFLISRFTRLYPTYWLCLTITLLFVFLIDDGRFDIGFFNSILNYLMFSKIFGIPFVDGAYWTLIYELVFYFWVFVSLLFKRDYLVEILSVFSFISLAFIVLGFDEKHMVFWCGSFVGYFLVGAVFYRIYINDFRRYHIPLLFFGGLLCLIQAYIQLEKKNQIPGVELSYYVVVCVLVALFVFFYLLSRGYVNFINCKCFWHLGVITYPCYLLHQNIGYIILNRFGDEISPWVLIFLFSSLLLVASYLIGRFFEPYVIGRSKKILGGFCERSLH